MAIHGTSLLFPAAVVLTQVNRNDEKPASISMGG